MKENKVITKSGWNLNCKEATYLTELSKEGKLTTLLKFRLWYHMSICQSCKNFKKQTLLLTQRLKNVKASHLLAPSDKERFSAEIKKALEKK